MNKAKYTIRLKYKNNNHLDNVQMNDRYLTDDLHWKLLWTEFEREVNLLQLQAMKLSLTAANRHNDKAEATQQKDWSKGIDFKDRFSKHRAKAAVVVELEQITNKELIKSQSVLSAIVSELSKEDSLSETSVLSDGMKSHIRTMEQSIVSLSKA